MRSIQVEKVRDAVRDMCIEANYSLSPDMRCVFEKACQEEKSPLGRQILNQLSENLEIAKKDEIPICQDTGMAVVFLEVGQEVHFEGGNLEEAVQEGIRLGYTEGYLRKSVVGDPVLRVNTGDNTPGVLYYEIVPGDRDSGCAQGLWKRKYEPCFYAETGRWPGRCQKCYPDGGKGCGTECLSSHGCRCRCRRYL